MATKRIDFDHETEFQSLGRNGFVQTHGVEITLMGISTRDDQGCVWFEPVTSRGSGSQACRLVIAATAINEVIAALTQFKKELGQ